MNPTFRDSELSAYLDEALPPAQMARIEAALRDDPSLVESLSEINRRRDAGYVALGELWRRGRLTCPSRQQLGGYLLGTIDPQTADYFKFHLESIGCRPCLANLEDLRQQAEAQDPAMAQSRRSKYFQSSAGYLSSS